MFCNGCLPFFVCGVCVCVCFAVFGGFFVLGVVVCCVRVCCGFIVVCLCCLLLLFVGVCVLCVI